VRDFIISTLPRLLLRSGKREVEMGGICSSHKWVRTAYKILIGKPAARDNFGDWST
jgi:hypothetical protein